MVAKRELDRVGMAVAKVFQGGFALIAIDGPGGSGKSTLAAELGGRLEGQGQVTVVHGDDFYRPMAGGDRLLLSPRGRLPLVLRLAAAARSGPRPAGCGDARAVSTL